MVKSNVGNDRIMGRSDVSILKHVEFYHCFGSGDFYDCCFGYIYFNGS